MDVGLAEELQRCRAIHAELLAVQGVPALDERQLLLAGFRSLALEHLGSVLGLCTEGRVGSALALIRPLIETVVRGEWLCFCADDLQCQHFMEGRFDRGCIAFRQMTRAVDNVLALGPRLQAIEELNRSMADFTQTGYEAVVPRFETGQLKGTCLPEQKLQSILRTSTLLVASHVDVALRAAQTHSSAAALMQSLEYSIEGE